jgi:eukaryotic-like serine/threonine-protein kinase
MEAIAPGDVIAGKYQIEREIGRGGMGIVFAALHVDLDQPVAVKILHEYAAYDQAAIARLLREARAAAKISSNHVVRVMDVGAFPEGGAYITMELLDGRDLADILREKGPIPVSEAVDYLIEACDAVAAAHSAGIVHRDLKPANLFVSQSDGISTIKVLDFGVSKIVPKSGQIPQAQELTQAGQIFGSPNYMSPEQLRSATDVDGRTDIWALGVVFYELVSGKLPFGGKSMADVLAAVVRDVPPPLSTVCPEVSPELAEVIAKCLEKEPGDRFADVVELANALAPFASPEKQGLVARIKRVVAVRAAAPSRSGSSEFFPTPARGIVNDKQLTPNTVVAVERVSRAGGSRIDSLVPAPKTTQSYRALVYVVAGLIFVAAAIMATRAAISETNNPVASNVPPPVTAAVPSTANSAVSAEPSSAPVVAPAEPSPSAMVVQNKAKFEFKTKPEKVQVFRDNVLLGTTPLSVEFDRSRTSIKLVFTAWGYRAQEVTIVPEGDRSMVVELAPAGAVRNKDARSTGGRVPGDLEPF